MIGILKLSNPRYSQRKEKKMKSKFKWAFIIVIGVMLVVGQAMAGEKEKLIEIFGHASPSVEEIQKAIEDGRLAPPQYEANSDLRFWPVRPCRIYDSRNFRGPFFPGEQSDLYIDNIETCGQGGACPSCPPPIPQEIYEPSAAALYIVAVPRIGQGNILVFPGNESAPANAAVLNYRTGVQNIGNSASIKAWDSFPGQDMRILNRNGWTDIVIDVFGYYYP
jgi:hypothetical protein